MIQIQKNKWFTFVELIIVMIILVILSLISFVSYQSYFKWVRDSARISTLKDLETSMDVYAASNAKYPQPSNAFAIAYSGAEVWQQWTIWNSIISQLPEFNEIPVDPLTDEEYTYSRSNTKNQYQIAAAYERDNVSWIELWSSVYAEWKQLATAYVWGNYNSLVVKVKVWWLIYLLSAPSILTADNSNTELVDIINNKTFIYNWYYNIPESYSGSKLKVLWWFDFTPSSDLIIYSWAELDSDASMTITGIVMVYMWSIIENNSYIAEIISVVWSWNVEDINDIYYEIINNL